jgi:hypothetical protein
MRSDPLLKITRPEGPTPQSGLYLELRGERKNTTTELHAMKRLAQIGVVIVVAIIVVGAAAMASQFAAGALSSADERLAVFVLGGLMLSGWGLLTYTAFSDARRDGAAIAPTMSDGAPRAPAQTMLTRAP